jgi:RHH-type transcriptional regulator, rel operon repressor / antitoxin RelB
MSTAVVSIRLPDDLKHRLDALSKSTGRPAAFYVREALSEHLDELEYAFTLRAEAEAARRGELETISHADLRAELGL